jgi:hypothetical protein
VWIALQFIEFIYVQVPVCLDRLGVDAAYSGTQKVGVI